MNTRRREVIYTLFSLLIILSAAYLPVTAQEQIPEQLPAVAKKFDEYGNVGSCDHSARLDNFAILLQNEPETKGYIVGYDPSSSAPGSSQRWIKYARYYLINMRGFDATRIATVGGLKNKEDELKTELWVAPQNAMPPTASPIDEKPSDFSGKYYSFSTEDGFYSYEGDTNGVSYLYDIIYQEYAARIKQQPQSHGYIVVSAATESVPGTARRIGKREAHHLRAMLGADKDRLTVIDGRQSGDGNKVELWILPKQSPPPATSAGVEKVVAQTLRLNTIQTYESKEDGNVQWVLENLADMLRDDAKARGCLVVHPPQPDEPVEEERNDGTAKEKSSAGDSEGEAEPNVVVLAGQWLKRLEKDFGIEEHRILVLIGRPDLWGSGEIETWVIPRDGDLPNPFAVPDNELSDGEAEEKETGTEEDGPKKDNMSVEPPVAALPIKSESGASYRGHAKPEHSIKRHFRL